MPSTIKFKFQNDEVYINFSQLVYASVNREKETVILKLPQDEKGVSIFRLTGPEATNVISQLESISES